MYLQRESNSTDRHHDEIDRAMCLGFRHVCTPALSLTKPNDLNLPILSFPQNKIRIILLCVRRCED